MDVSKLPNRVTTGCYSLISVIKLGVRMYQVCQPHPNFIFSPLAFWISGRPQDRPNETRESFPITVQMQHFIHILCTGMLLWCCPKFWHSNEDIPMQNTEIKCGICAVLEKHWIAQFWTALGVLKFNITFSLSRVSRIFFCAKIYFSLTFTTDSVRSYSRVSLTSPSLPTW